MTITNQDIDQIVKEAGQRFLHQERCVANKPNMTELVDRLEEYTEEVATAAETYGLTTDANVAQWNKDYNNWLLRLARYRRALKEARYEGGAESCEELRASVNEPLLVGWYEPGTPGIVNPEVQTVADVATPYMLGNQVIVYRQHQEERIKMLIEDLFLLTPEAREGVLDYWCERTGTCGPGGWRDCDLACWAKRVGIAAVAIGGVYLVYRGVKAGIGARRRAASAVLPQGPYEPNPALVEICEMPGMFAFVDDAQAAEIARRG